MLIGSNLIVIMEPKKLLSSLRTLDTSNHPQILRRAKIVSLLQNPPPSYTSSSFSPPAAVHFYQLLSAASLLRWSSAIHLKLPQSKPPNHPGIPRFVRSASACVSVFGPVKELVVTGRRLARHTHGYRLTTTTVIYIVPAELSMVRTQKKKNRQLSSSPPFISDRIFELFPRLCRRKKETSKMPRSLISGLPTIIFRKNHDTATFTSRYLVHLKSLVGTISSSPCSVENTTSYFGHVNKLYPYLEKYVPNLSCGTNLVNSLCIRRPYLLGPHSVNMVRGYARHATIAPIELNTDGDVIRFNMGNQSHEGAPSKKARVDKRKSELSRKAKLNELRFYRLKAKKKMNSPNPDVRIRYKLEKAKRKEAWLIEKLRKYELPKAPPETYDPEILTEEEKFYLKRTGERKKHYVPVGRRGVFGGVVLNMHLHWKNHETVKVVCRPCKPGQVHQYAEELARLSKGIVIDIKPNNVIIFYRGKNYVQPDVISPTNTLSKAKALEKYRHEQSLEHTSQFIEKLENELEEYHDHLARILQWGGRIGVRLFSSAYPHMSGPSIPATAIPVTGGSIT
ncbi:RNA-binding CRS1 / YhbY (CRM) domain protein [Striga hermonthica]|uniref:RNA-binding CRS1 / YhbY (CRM) domain protein n=1 Tax=Striga hermonthica TaxID=68872 RepID=A0A9N7MIS6_STRHE|nr:RNA-binding CRS1 / YhbY (CRM) domain protein [Striga hermonthica]